MIRQFRLVFLVILAVVWAVNAQAYSVDYVNTTLLETWWGHSSTGDPPTDSVGGDPYRIFGSRVTWTGTNVTINIFGKYPLAGTPESGVADLFFFNPANYGIYMSGVNLGKLVKNVTANSPEFYFGDDLSFEYANRFWDGSQWRPGLATIASGDYTGITATVTETLSGGIYNWQIFLPGVNAGGDWDDLSYFVSAGRCNNAGHYVPLPSTALLLGSGILALLVLRLRRRLT